MSRLQKKPPAHKRGHPTLQNMNFFYFCGSFLPSWIRIRIPNTDPLARLNTDPIRIRIRNPATNFTKLKIILFLNAEENNLAQFSKNLKLSFAISVSDPDPDWIRIQSGQWIRIRNPDPEPGGQKWPTKVEIFFKSSCFEVLDGLFCELQASSVTWTCFMEA